MTLIWLWLYWKPALTGQDSKQHSSKLDAKEIVSYTANNALVQNPPSQHDGAANSSDPSCSTG